MELRKENTNRKIDSLGRVSIPKSMRERLEIAEGDEMEFYVLVDECGDQYVAMTNHKSGANKYAIAA